MRYEDTPSMHGHEQADERSAIQPFTVPLKRSFVKKSLIWLCALALVSMAIVGLGVHLGANGQGKWYTEVVVWLVTKLK